MIGVTGATGRVGGRVARSLAEQGVAQRLLVRRPEDAPDLPGAEVAPCSYDEPAGLDGVDTLLLVSAREHPDRVGQHTRMLDAAVAAGVGRVVYTSILNPSADATFTFARDHWATEQHLATLDVQATVLRDSLYADFLALMRGDDAVIRGPAGDGRLAAVAIEDVAACATAALVDPDLAGTYELTGPELLTMTDVARILTDHGSPTTYVAETLEEAYASRASYGAPAFEVDGWVTSYAAIADGSLDKRTDDVRRLTGREPLSLPQLLAR